MLYGAMTTRGIIFIRQEGEQEPGSPGAAPLSLPASLLTPSTSLFSYNFPPNQPPVTSPMYATSGLPSVTTRNSKHEFDTIEVLLKSLKLEKYIPKFQAEQVTIDELPGACGTIPLSLAFPMCFFSYSMSGLVMFYCFL